MNNINKERSRWTRARNILTREKVNSKVMGLFYKAIIQSILLYSSETWVLVDESFNKLSTFHAKNAISIARSPIKCHSQYEDEDVWIYPNMDEVM